MTIRKRFFWSNILMIIIPIALSCIVSYIILFAFTKDSSIPLERAFPQAFNTFTRFARSGDLEALQQNVDDFNESLAADGVYMVIMEGDAFLYPEYSQQLIQDSAPLFQILIREGATGSVYINNNLYFIEAVNGYRIILVDTNGNAAASRPSFRNTFLLIIIVPLIILCTNRMLTYLLTRSITVPLRKLTEGARRLGSGELDYRIVYKGKDEFVAVCHAFNEMADHLQKLISYQQKNEQSRKELLAGISHDLRTPLTSIRAYVEGLLDGVAEDLSAQLKYLGIIRNKAEDIDRLVDKLFLFSKLDLEEYPVNPTQLDVGEELESLETIVREEYEEKGLFMTLEHAPQNVYIHVDPVYLHNIFMNILENSVRYKQRERCQVQVACLVSDLSVTISLTDDGPGVAEHELDKLFDVFYRGDPSRQNPSKGSGLGLAISARMMNRLGGSICAENAPEGGLRTILQFPRYYEDDERSREQLKRILIIEDDQAIAEIEQDYLSISGYQADIVGDGQTGIDAALTGVYDLILLDLMLPGVDGFTVCRTLRETLDIPILMVTAKKEDIDKIRGLGIGADDYIVKPFSPSELVARIKAHLTRYDRLVGSGGTQNGEKEFQVGRLTIQPGPRRVLVNGEEIELKNKEYELLQFLMSNADIVFSKEALYERIWGMDSLGDSATVTVHINRLREKIEENPSKPRYIQTVWGAGYRFCLT